VSVWVCLNVCVYMRMCVCLHGCIWVFTRMCVLACLFSWMCATTRMCVHMNVRGTWACLVFFICKCVCCLFLKSSFLCVVCVCDVAVPAASNVCVYVCGCIQQVIWLRCMSKNGGAGCCSSRIDGSFVLFKNYTLAMIVAHSCTHLYSWVMCFSQTTL
jgi:hypothetical protein